eukprot:TRINITY_DN999_c0_g1_i20.p1 TRINITY_DN999_c0_g1~~TRINITY_DN999_c0_g1_i20.p1  ORF type:complete len:676 (-),score=130.14 TRINITY_DN999_c0_g1_i20:4883-6910(-)
MELQFGYTNPSQEPYGINQFIGGESESERENAKTAPPEKKVRFKEELELKPAQPLLLEFETPKPLVINKGATQVPQKQQRRSLSAKKKSGARPKTAVKKKAPVIAKKKPVPAAKGEWNMNTAAPKYFDPSLDKKRATSSKTERGAGTNRKVEVSREGGKITGKIQTVGVPKTIEIYRDVNDLLSEERLSKSPKTFLKKGAGKAVKPRIEPKPMEKGKENIVAQPILEEEKVDPEKERMRYEFNKKNEYLKSLQEELNNEKALRAQMDTEYKTKMDSMVNLVKHTVTSLEKRKAKEAELDLVPQKEVPEVAKPQEEPKQIAKPQVKPKVVTKPAVKRPEPPVFKPLRPKPISSQKPKILKPIMKKEESTPSVTVFTDEMKKREIERQVQLDSKTATALERLDKIAYKPAEELDEVTQHLEKFEGRMRPVIEKVDQTIKDIERIERIKTKGSLIGMVSNMGARYIVTYADQITELMVEDLLEEFADEMNEIEEKQKKNIFSLEQQELALELLEQAAELEEEQARVKNRWIKFEQEQPVKGVELKISEGEYVNPFETGKIVAAAQPSTEEAKMITIYKPPKKHMIIPSERSRRINEYAKKYKEYRRKMEGSVSPDIWKIYDHITNDILSEVLEGSAEEFSEILEQYVEQMISNEFISQLCLYLLLDFNVSLYTQTATS